MVPFAGYELPVLYKAENGGVMKEHLWCRDEGKAAMFDVSHMGQVSFALHCIALAFVLRLQLCKDTFLNWNHEILHSFENSLFSTLIDPVAWKGQSGISRKNCCGRHERPRARIWMPLSCNQR